MDVARAETCAICLTSPEVADVALVKQCLHAFCARCVAKWYATGERGATTKCPCCKVSFDTVLVYRTLNGEVVSHDGALVEESLCLLARARWVRARGEASDDGEEEERERRDDDFLDDDRDDDDVITRGGKRRTVVIGNRKFGRGGYVNSGRQYARPRAPTGNGKDVVGEVDKASPSSCGKPLKGSTSSPAVNIPTTPSRKSEIASPSDGECASSASSPRDAVAARGKKSAKRQESLAKKRDKEQSKAAARLKRREDEQAADAAKKIAKALAVLALVNASEGECDRGNEDDDFVVAARVGVVAE